MQSKRRNTIKKAKAPMRVKFTVLKSRVNEFCNRNSRMALIIKIAASVVLIAVIVLLVITAINHFANNNSPKEEVSINSDAAREIDPTNYNMSDEDKTKYNNKFDELLGEEGTNTDAVYNYFTDEINKYLNKKDYQTACKILWVEHDAFMAKGMLESALEALLRMDDSNLEKYQKIYLYRAIVTASVFTGDKETEDKYTKLVQELDPPTIINDAKQEENAE